MIGSTSVTTDGSGIGSFSVPFLVTVSTGQTVTATATDSDGNTSEFSGSVAVTETEVEFTAAAYADSEGAGTSLVVELVRTDGSTVSHVLVSITGGSADGGNIDYDDSGFPLNVTFSIGESTKSVPVPIVQDDLVEPDETITFEVTSVSGAAIGLRNSATLTILNDDSSPIADAGGPYAIDEGNSLVLDASATTDARSASLAYRWDVDGDGDFDENITGETPTVDWTTLVSLGINDGPDGPRTVSVEASDGANTSTDATSLSIDNVDPSIVSITSSATFESPANEGQTVTVSGTFSDPGTLDTHTALINWGDGTQSNATIDQIAGTFSGDHVYDDGGIYHESVTLADDDLGESNAVTNSVVIGVGLNNGVLRIIGTNADDEVTVKKKGSDKVEVDTNFDSPNKQEFPLAGVQSIHIVLLEGDDQADIRNGFTIPTIVEGGPGSDNLKGGDSDDHLVGGPDDDILDGNRGNDVLDGGDGNDILKGDQGDDVMAGGTGNDTLDAGYGNDQLDGGEGDDELKGDQGDDVLTGGVGNDTLDAGYGADILDGGDGDDVLKGDQGDDHMTGGAGNDLLDAGYGNDVVDEGDGDDTLQGDQGDDLLLAGAGDDTIDAGYGHDILIGGDGDDVLMGDQGNDFLIGGIGQDDLQCGSAGSLLIAGWTIYDSDTVALDAIHAEWSSNASYQTRVNNLLTGAGSLSGTSIKLEAGTTVFDDGIQDEVVGLNNAQDMFFADLDGADGDDDSLQGNQGDVVMDLAELLMP